METVNVLEAQNRLSELISRVIAGERIVIQSPTQSAVALISTAELEQLEQPNARASRLARALGQAPQLLADIEIGVVHPVMAAFGLWQEEAELDAMLEDVYSNRDQQPPRPELVV